MQTAWRLREEMCSLLADKLGVSADDVVVASTGVIGQPLDIAPIAAGIPQLGRVARQGLPQSAAQGIMTTDTQAQRDRRGISPSAAQDLPPRRDCQGLRNDPPQYGNHAGLSDDGLCNQHQNAAAGALRRCVGNVQHGQRGRRYFHQRYGHASCKRNGGQRGNHRTGGETSMPSCRRSTR